MPQEKPRPNVWPGDKVAIAGQTVRIAPPCAAGGTGTTEPEIHLVREDDLVRAIDVVCSCGQTLRIALQYAGASVQEG